MKRKPVPSTITAERSPPRWVCAVTAAILSVSCGAGAPAQSLIAAERNTNGASRLLVIDPATGVATPYFSVPLPPDSSYQITTLGTLPDGRLVGTVYRDNGVVNTSGKLIVIDPSNGESAILNFGPPLSTSTYIRSLDYSPRHGAVMVSHRNTFDLVNRLSLIQLDGSVISTATLDTYPFQFTFVACGPSSDVMLDLFGSSSPRVRSLTNLLPDTSLSTVASPPNFNVSHPDVAMHPTTGEIWFSSKVSQDFLQTSRLFRLVGDAYVPGATLTTSGILIHGLTWASLPALANVSPASPVCPTAPASLTVTPAGTGPFTYRWQCIGGPPPANVPTWTDVSTGINVAPPESGAPGRFLFNASGVTASTLIVNRSTVPSGDPGLPNWSHAGVGQFRFRCVVTGSVGAPFVSAETTLQLVSDLNFDGLVNTVDLTTFLGRFGQPAPLGSEPARADFNADGVVNTADLTFFLGRFGSACP
jgi:hypothetical protein